MFFLSRLKHRYPVVSEYRRLLSERKALWEEAARLFGEEKPSQGSLRDYKNALKRHRVSYREYMYGYEFWKLDEKGRGEFVSQRQMKCIYRKATDERVKRCFIDKKAFLSAIHVLWVESGYGPRMLHLKRFRIGYRLGNVWQSRCSALRERGFLLSVIPMRMRSGGCGSFAGRTITWLKKGSGRAGSWQSFILNR